MCPLANPVLWPLALSVFVLWASVAKKAATKLLAHSLDLLY